MKLKPIYNYLGDGTSLLNNKALARCPSCCPPDLPESIPIYDIGAASLTALSRKHPELIKVNSNTFFLMYVGTNLLTLYYRVGTVAADMTVTLTTEQTLVTGTTVAGYHGAYMEDDKIAIIYKNSGGGGIVRVVNFSGTTPTFGATTAIDSTHSPSMDLAPFRLGRHDRNKYIIASVNSDNLKMGFQVVDIDNSDVISLGLVYKSATTNNSHPRIATLSESKGLLGSSNSSVNVSGRVIQYSVSGTVVTIGGTTLDLVTSAQFPAPSSRQFFFNDIYPLTSTTAMAWGGCSFVISGITRRGIAIVQVTADGGGSGIPSANSGLFDETTMTGLTGDPTSCRGSLIHKDDDTMIGLIDNNSGAPNNRLTLAQYSSANPPILIHNDIVETTDINADAALVDMGNNLNIGAYQNATENLVKVFAMRYVL